MKTLSNNELELFFKDIESDYDVRLPVRLQDGTRTLGKPCDGTMSLSGGVLPVKITNVFFPQNECILSVDADEIQMQQTLSKPLLVVGLTAADADCLEFVDRFFNTNYRDGIYFNKRNDAAVFCISGWSGPSGEFMRISGGKCDVELIYDRNRFIIKTYTQTTASHCF